MAVLYCPRGSRGRSYFLFHNTQNTRGDDYDVVYVRIAVRRVRGTHLYSGEDRH